MSWQTTQERPGEEEVVPLEDLPGEQVSLEEMDEFTELKVSWNREAIIWIILVWKNIALEFDSYSMKLTLF